MTEEEKINLLLIDLCARLPYHVKVAIDYEKYLNILPDENFKEHFLFLLRYDKKTIEEKSLEPHIICSYPCKNRFMTLTGCHDEYGVPIKVIKPYLRPMSSMTKKEQSRYDILVEETVYRPGVLTCSMLINFCNEHHLDNLGLIEKGLAIEAPKGMYMVN